MIVFTTRQISGGLVFRSSDVGSARALFDDAIGPMMQDLYEKIQNNTVITGLGSKSVKYALRLTKLPEGYFLGLMATEELLNELGARETHYKLYVCPVLKYAGGMIMTKKTYLEASLQLDQMFQTYFTELKEDIRARMPISVKKYIRGEL